MSNTEKYVTGKYELKNEASSKWRHEKVISQRRNELSTIKKWKEILQLRQYMINMVISFKCMKP